MVSEYLLICVISVLACTVHTLTICLFLTTEQANVNIFMHSLCLINVVADLCLLP